MHVVNGLNDYGMIKHRNKWMQGHLLVPRIERAGLALLTAVRLCQCARDLSPCPLQDNKPFI